MGAGLNPAATEAFVDLALSEGMIESGEADVWRRAFSEDASEAVRLLARRPRDKERAVRNFMASPAAKRHEAELAAALGVRPEELI